MQDDKNQTYTLEQEKADRSKGASHELRGRRDFRRVLREGTGVRIAGRQARNAWVEQELLDLAQQWRLMAKQANQLGQQGPKLRANKSPGRLQAPRLSAARDGLPRRLQHHRVHPRAVLQGPMGPVAERTAAATGAWGAVKLSHGSLFKAAELAWKV